MTEAVKALRGKQFREKKQLKLLVSGQNVATRSRPPLLGFLASVVQVHVLASLNQPPHKSSRIRTHALSILWQDTVL